MALPSVEVQKFRGRLRLFDPALEALGVLSLGWSPGHVFLGPDLHEVSWYIGTDHLPTARGLW